jgi:hypothetical protein
MRSGGFCAVLFTQSGDAGLDGAGRHVADERGDGIENLLPPDLRRLLGPVEHGDDGMFIRVSGYQCAHVLFGVDAPLPRVRDLPAQRLEQRESVG